jgi:hypothetical protein
VTESFAYMSLFRQHSDSFNPETLVVLESILDETWTALQANRKAFNEMKTRAAIADLIVKFAQQGERDPQKLKALVLAALPSYEAQ